ncbi:four helix bundle protein [Lysobacter enzymogenes]|uniref:four helix bundle protein n=1 Tax=Lysobacter enzymogenes TaxID=69 RepID=UPI00099B8959|nr:four helix bundle protein [Lysobacter enzymogenes]UZW62722.1 four helix bundle protein [Lysobacter enzymogenes]
MAYDLPPIAKAAARLLVEIEQAVQRFARRHRHATGADLRAQAMHVARLVNRAWRDRSRQLHWVTELAWAVDELRLTMQLAKEVKAFRSFGQFEALIRQVEDLGRQAGGWKRQQEHLKGQSPAPRLAPGRAQTLSTCAASTGANR